MGEKRTGVGYSPDYVKKIKEKRSTRRATGSITMGENKVSVGTGKRTTVGRRQGKRSDFGVLTEGNMEGNRHLVKSNTPVGFSQKTKERHHKPEWLEIKKYQKNRNVKWL